MRTIDRLRRKTQHLLVSNWDRLIGPNGGVLAIVINNRHMGFFAHLNMVTSIIREAEERNVTPIIYCESENYQDPDLGKNWLGYFFEAQDKVSSRPRKFVRICTDRDLGLSRPDDLGLQEARALLFRHFAIKPEIMRQCDEFCALNRVSSRSLAVHYRGTDKVAEAPRVAYQKILEVVEQTLQTGNHDRVFVATDEQAFAAAIVDRLGAQRVVYYDFARSSGEAPLHRGTGGSHAYDMGRSALLDCLTLSRCGAIVRTASLLSSWASIFNPDLPVTLMSAAHDNRSWWPERVIARSHALLNY